MRANTIFYSVMGGVIAVSIGAALLAMRGEKRAPFLALPAITVAGLMLGRREAHLVSESTTDPLTGLANRRALQHRLFSSLRDGERSGRPLTLLLIDVDRMKSINDRHGHAGGDHALETVAAAIGRSCRGRDLTARHGGDEFAVVAPDCTAEEAMAMARRIMEALPRPLTVSVGVADVARAGEPTTRALFAAADGALYAAKAAGGGRAFLASPPGLARRTPAAPTTETGGHRWVG